MKKIFANYMNVNGSISNKFQKLWKILKEMGIPDHLNCLLRNLYAGQEAIVRTGHETMDWLDILAVQGTLKGLLQHLSSKASIHQCSAFFTVQLSHSYMTTLISIHDCVDHHKLKNSERDGNTRPPDLPLEKSVCRPGSNS